MRDGGKTPLKDAAPKIKATLVARKSEHAAQARADEVKTALLGAPDFAAAPSHATALRRGPLALVFRNAVGGRLSQSQPIVARTALRPAGFGFVESLR